VKPKPGKKQKKQKKSKQKAIRSLKAMDGVIDVQHKTLKQIMKETFNDAQKNDKVININEDTVDTVDGEKMKLKTYNVALMFFHTAAVQNEQKFNSLQGLINLEVDTISKYLTCR
jgi:hypothetical protein